MDVAIGLLVLALVLFVVNVTDGNVDFLVAIAGPIGLVAAGALHALWPDDAAIGWLALASVLLALVASLQARLSRRRDPGEGAPVSVRRWMERRSGGYRGRHADSGD